MGLTQTTNKPKSKATASASPDDVLKDALKDALKAAGKPKRETITAGIRGKSTTRGEGGGGTKPPTDTSKPVRGTTGHKYKLDPKRARGSALVANGTSYSGGVFDAYSMGSGYLGYKDEHPEWSKEQQLTMASREDPTPAGDVSKADAGSATNPTTGRKYAAVIGNNNYPGDWDLTNAIPDAEAMKSSLNGEGYKTSFATDVGSSGIESRFEAISGMAKPGDEVTLYFAGHGVSEGLCGSGAKNKLNVIDWGINPETGKSHPPTILMTLSDLVPHSFIGGLAGKAVSEGWHLTAIMDCCASGGIADAVRFEMMQYMKSMDDSKTTEYDMTPTDWETKGFATKDGRKTVSDAALILDNQVK